VFFEVSHSNILLKTTTAKKGIEAPVPWRSSEVENHLRKKGLLISIAESFTADKSAVPQYIHASVRNSSGSEQ